MTSHLFVNVMILLSLSASGVYAYQKNLGLCLYWFFAAAINITVTYIINKGSV